MKIKIREDEKTYIVNVKFSKWLSTKLKSPFTKLLDNWGYKDKAETAFQKKIGLEWVNYCEARANDEYFNDPKATETTKISFFKYLRLIKKYKLN
jgi:hypothetical protein